MKALNYWTLVCLFLISINGFTTVRTVSNNPATIAQFSTIQSAIDASADSDTVYVYGSPNTYDAFTILDKRITVFGPGRSPDKNLPLQAIVNGATLRNSPAGGSADGSELHGLVFVGEVNLTRSQVGGDGSVNNVRVMRCQFSNRIIWQLNATGHLLEGNIFYNQLNFTGSASYTNFLFQNNIFYFNAAVLPSQISSLTNSVNVRFDHNLFYSNNNAGGSVVSVFGSNCRFLNFSNNIFNQANAGLNVSFSTFTNNITNNITLNSSNAVSNATPWSVNNNVDGGGNIANQSPQLSAQTAVDAGNGSQLLDFRIVSGPANDAGSDGKDLGLLYDTVGSLNWDNSRNARLPRIFSMNITTPTVSPGGNISVTIDARKSN